MTSSELCSPRLGQAYAEPCEADEGMNFDLDSNMRCPQVMTIGSAGPPTHSCCREPRS